MQCKDIPDRPLLQYLYGRYGIRHTWFPGFENSVQQAMPKDTPEKVALAKMRKLISRGLVSGCACGCRGDFEITGAGVAFLARPPKPSACAGTSGSPQPIPRTRTA